MVMVYKYKYNFKCTYKDKYKFKKKYIDVTFIAQFALWTTEHVFDLHQHSEPKLLKI